MNYLNRHYLLQIPTYLILLALLQFTKCQLESPCPNIFEYRYDNNNNLYGYIKVPTPDDNKLIRLEVQLSVGNRVQGSNGQIELVSSREDVIQDIIKKRAIEYNLHFPAWTNIPPKITEITLNGQLLCRGDPIEKFTVPILTTINLQHTLTLSIQLSGGKDGFDTSNGIPIDSNTQWFQINFPQSGGNRPTRPQLNTDFDGFVNSFSQTGGNRRPPTQSNRPTRPQFNQDYDGFGNSRPSVDSNRPFRPPSQPNRPFWPQTNPNNDTFINPPLPEVTRRPPVSTTRPPPIQNPDDGLEVNWRPPRPSKPNSQNNICGLSSNTNSLIVNGETYEQGTHPWLGALFVQNDDAFKFICGSTLVSKRHVVTAGHCVRSRRKRYRSDEIWIVLGRENIQRWSNDGGEVIQAEKIHLHQDFKFTSADGDIAIVELLEEVIFSRLVRPACIWKSDANSESLADREGVVIGWGKDENGKTVASQPKRATVTIVGVEKCLRSNVAFSEITSDRTFCAEGKNNSGPCNGDSGGGLLIDVDGRWTLRGITSMSLRNADYTCDLTKYVVYADVVMYREWLSSIIRN